MATLKESPNGTFQTLGDPFRVEWPNFILSRRLHLRLPTVITFGDANLPDGEKSVSQDLPS